MQNVNSRGLNEGGSKWDLVQLALQEFPHLKKKKKNKEQLISLRFLGLLHKHKKKKQTLKYVVKDIVALFRECYALGLAVPMDPPTLKVELSKLIYVS